MSRLSETGTQDQRINILVAYPYMKSEVISILHENRDRVRFLLDSGAFTAWKAGKQIELDDYCRFLESLPFEPWRYFTLDVIGDPKRTVKNYETMVSRGFSPIPIFTRGEDPSYLEDYYKTSQVVGIGGLVGTERNKGFVKGIMSLVRGRKTHLLGFTNLQFLKVYRPYMADSSTWVLGAKFGATSIYLGGGSSVRFTRKTARKDLSDPRVVSAIQRMGLNPNIFLDREEWRYRSSAIWKLQARNILRMQRDLSYKLRTHLFSACAIPNDIQQLLDAKAALDGNS